MRKWALSVVVLAGIALAIPLLASAGWAGSIYDRSECRYTKASNVLYCETTRRFANRMTEQMAIPDAACPSGTTLVSRRGTFVEVWRVFDAYAGRTPQRRNNLFGDDVPLLDRWHWQTFTDTPLGCV